MFRRKLVALGFPHANTFDPSDDINFRTLLVWLEETKIRHLPLSDRVPLRAITNEDGSVNEAWPAAFQSYAASVNCPAALVEAVSAGKRNGLVDWFLSQAITAEFSDHKAQFNQVEPRPLQVQAGPDGASAAEPELAGCDTEEFVAVLREAAALVQIPETLEDPALVLKVLQRRVAELAKGSAEASSSAAPSASSSSKKQKAIADVYQEAGRRQLGFTTGDAQLDRAAAVLRLLYINELRQVQTTLNEALVFVQEYTANPKVQASLGKVGR